VSVDVIINIEACKGHAAMACATTFAFNPDGIAPKHIFMVVVANATHMANSTCCCPSLSYLPTTRTSLPRQCIGADDNLWVELPNAVAVFFVDICQGRIGPGYRRQDDRLHALEKITVVARFAEDEIGNRTSSMSFVDSMAVPMLHASTTAVDVGDVNIHTTAAGATS
jgi:hypothetical protein